MKGMKVSRATVLEIIRYLIDNPKFYFPFIIRCKGLDGSDEYVEVIAQEDDYEMLVLSDDFTDFILIENLQNLYPETVELMSKGFIDKIKNKDSVGLIQKLAKENRDKWNLELCNSEDIEVYGENEWFGGQADAYENALQILGKKDIK